MQLNIQPPERPDSREDGSLDVHSVWLTLQGEGPFSGSPAVFVRLAGCSLCCLGCDSEYTKGRKRIGYMRLFNELGKVLPLEWNGSLSGRLVVITGGEPLRQNVSPFVGLLQESAGAIVQIETNGVHEVPDDLRAVIICSPKTPVVKDSVFVKAAGLKYILDADHVSPADGLPTTTLNSKYPARPSAKFKGIIYVQPMDEQDPERNKLHQQAALESCMKYGYRLSLQTHKILGLP